VPPRTGRAALAALVLTTQLSGCYSYVPVTSAGPRPTGEVAVAITEAGRSTMAPVLGPDARRIHGRLLPGADSAFVLAVTQVHRLGAATSEPWAGERIEVPRTLVADVRARRLSRPRTALVVGLALVAAVVASTLAIEGFGTEGDRSRPPPDGTPDS
jgi:hypothetical protein